MASARPSGPAGRRAGPSRHGSRFGRAPSAEGDDGSPPPPAPPPSRSRSPRRREEQGPGTAQESRTSSRATVPRKSAHCAAPGSRFSRSIRAQLPPEPAAAAPLPPPGAAQWADFRGTVAREEVRDLLCRARGPALPGRRGLRDRDGGGAGGGDSRHRPRQRGRDRDRDPWRDGLLYDSRTPRASPTPSCDSKGWEAPGLEDSPERAPLRPHHVSVPLHSSPRRVSVTRAPRAGRTWSSSRATASSGAGDGSRARRGGRRSPRDRPIVRVQLRR